MGLADRFKDLKAKAEDAVVERSDQIHNAVEKAAAVADQRTGGKYSERIQKAGAKADDLVDSLKENDGPASAAGDEPASAEAEEHGPSQ
jgi:DNA-binding protein H-NS